MSAFRVPRLARVQMAQVAIDPLAGAHLPCPASLGIRGCPRRIPLPGAAVGVKQNGVHHHMVVLDHLRYRQSLAS
jgi:hypothetical protein